MAASVLFDDEIEIPGTIGTLAEFRRWTCDHSFPNRGRIDYISGRIEVDMSPEDVLFHGQPKSEIHASIYSLVKKNNLGMVFVDRTRISNSTANLSAEPDVVFVSHESLASGRARFVAKSTGEADRYVEIEGSPDLVVEVVSDNSVTKDTKRLPVLYFAAGVREYWYVDARGKRLTFHIYRRGRERFMPVKPDARGFQRSAVLSQGFRLMRRRNDLGYWTYDLRMCR